MSINWKSLAKTVAHAAIGGLGTGLAAVNPASPMTSANVLVPALLSAATSSYSALSDSTTANPALHALIGFVPVALFAFASGQHASIAALAPAAISAITSAASSQLQVTNANSN